MQSIKQYYDEKSSNYDRVLENLYFRIYDTITWKYTEPYIPTDPRSLVLDAGGGTGRWSIPIAKKGCKVVLLDVSEGMLKQAQAKINRENLQEQVAVKKGDILNLDFHDETFDLVFCDHTLFLFPDPSRVIRELIRVLKKNSTIVISAQNKYPLALLYVPDDLKKANNLISGQYYHKLGNIRVYTVTPNEFREMLKAKNLRIEKMIGKGISMPLRIPPDIFCKKEYSGEFFNKILQIELALCERSDTLGLAGHLQVIAQKL
jgi:ubiquinone/menaquinone biosynthesis C-methylase UbiE